MILDQNFETNKNKDPQEKLLDAEMVLQNSSLAHEYVRIELEEVQSSFQEEQLLEKLEGYKTAYFSARQYLEQFHPERLEKLEKELMHQKREIFTFYSA
jgi:hypothetical protein